MQGAFLVNYVGEDGFAMGPFIAWSIGKSLADAVYRGYTIRKGES